MDQWHFTICFSVNSISVSRPCTYSTNLPQGDVRAVTCSITCPLLGRLPDVCDRAVGRANPALTQTVNWLQSDLYPSLSGKLENGGWRGENLTFSRWIDWEGTEQETLSVPSSPAQEWIRRTGTITDMTFCHRRCSEWNTLLVTEQSHRSFMISVFYIWFQFHVATCMTQACATLRHQSNKPYPSTSLNQKKKKYAAFLTST